MGVTFFQLQHYFRRLNPLDRWFLFDSQAGVELVHTLMVCGEALQLNNLELAYMLVNRIVLSASLPTGAMSKVAKYFAEAFARRINRFQRRILHELLSASPYLKLAHLIADQAILKAF
ncbi:putative transcription factor GRAS family [Medicago truncatula]|uniref:GRAS family transcription factor n=1 Tax=Medicago truncatula TaxID=3880 RepID=G7JNX8_MEDTR|nr:GRAS family transcription factor [Medicago truncatula]RHN64377.1 putative transcription factor GRAS family [Medicago truncatula]